MTVLFEKKQVSMANGPSWRQLQSLSPVISLGLPSRWNLDIRIIWWLPTWGLSPHIPRLYIKQNATSRQRWVPGNSPGIPRTNSCKHPRDIAQHNTNNIQRKHARIQEHKTGNIAHGRTLSGGGGGGGGLRVPTGNPCIPVHRSECSVVSQPATLSQTR